MADDNSYFEASGPTSIMDHLQDQLHELSTYTFARPQDPEEDPSGVAAFRAACEKIDRGSRQAFLRFPSDAIMQRLRDGVDEVSFIHCGLGDKGVMALGEALKVKQSIVALDLSDNGITHAGLLSILAVLPKNIKTLNLSSNRLSRGGSICLSSDLMYVKEQQQQQQLALANLVAQQQKEAEKVAAKKAKRDSARSVQQQEQSARGESSVNNNAPPPAGKNSSAPAPTTSTRNNNNKLPPQATVGATTSKATANNQQQQLQQSTIDPAASGVPPIGAAASANFNASALGITQNALGATVSAYNGAAGSSIGQLLSKNVTLQILSLKENKLNDTDIVGLAEGLAENTTLFSLDLSHNEIGPSCASALATVLLRSELKEINLEWNKLQNVGAVTLIREGLPVTTVKRIFLGWNGLGDEAAEALGKVLAGSSTLEELDISNNHVGPKGAALLAKGVQTAIALTILLINDNPLAEEGCLALLRAISESQTIAKVDMRSTGAGKKSAELLPSLITKKLDAGVDFSIDMPRQAADINDD